MGDHTETVRVEFNPQEISYPELLKIFWAGHNPRYNSSKRKYRNAIFYLNEQQRQQAEQSRAEIETLLGGSVQTDIEPLSQFYLAEDYHQKYYLRSAEAFFSELKAIYPDEKQLAASTAAARVNGYLGCNGKADGLTREIGRLGLSFTAQQRLAGHLSSSCSSFKGFTCPAPK